MRLKLLEVLKFRIRSQLANYSLDQVSTVHHRLAEELQRRIDRRDVPLLLGWSSWGHKLAWSGKIGNRTRPFECYIWDCWIPPRSRIFKAYCFINHPITPESSSYRPALLEYFGGHPTNIKNQKWAELTSDRERDCLSAAPHNFDGLSPSIWCLVRRLESHSHWGKRQTRNADVISSPRCTDVLCAPRPAKFASWKCMKFSYSQICLMVPRWDWPKIEPIH